MIAVYIVYIEELGSQLSQCPKIEVYRHMVGAKYAVEEKIHQYASRGFTIDNIHNSGDVCCVYMRGQYRRICIRCELKEVRS